MDKVWGTYIALFGIRILVISLGTNVVFILPTDSLPSFWDKGKILGAKSKSVQMDVCTDLFLWKMSSNMVTKWYCATYILKLFWMEETELTPPTNEVIGMTTMKGR